MRSAVVPEGGWGAEDVAGASEGLTGAELAGALQHAVLEVMAGAGGDGALLPWDSDESRDAAAGPIALPWPPVAEALLSATVHTENAAGALEALKEWSWKE